MKCGPAHIAFCNAFQKLGLFKYITTKFYLNYASCSSNISRSKNTSNHTSTRSCGVGGEDSFGGGCGGIVVLTVPAVPAVLVDMVLVVLVVAVALVIVCNSGDGPGDGGGGAGRSGGHGDHGCRVLVDTVEALVLLQIRMLIAVSSALMLANNNGIIRINATVEAWGFFPCCGIWGGL